MKKLIITVLICLLCCVCLYMVNYPVKAATVLTENRERMNVPCTFSKLLNEVIYS